MTTRVSIAELAAADIQLRPAEAVALVSEICRQYSAGQLHGIPSPGVIRLTEDGTVVAEGPTTTDQLEVRRAAHLLSDLLPDFEAPRDYRASGGLRLVIARALGTLDLPPYETLEDFCHALGRFSVPDLGTTVRSLFAAWQQSQASRRPPSTSTSLTISDIRRARRATGLSLDDLAAVSDVPAARLRELEWGYLRNWPADDNGRQQVARYARAAGLDEDVVLSIAWPMLLAWPAGADGLVVEESSQAALVPAAVQHIVVMEPRGPRRRSRVPAIGLAVGSVALLAFGTGGLFAGKTHRARATAPQLVTGGESTLAAAAGPAVTEPDAGSAAPSLDADGQSVAPASGADARTTSLPLAAGTSAASAIPQAEGGTLTAVSYVRPVPSRRAAETQMRSSMPASRTSSPAARRRRSARAQAILHKELFRIVIR